MAFPGNPNASIPVDFITTIQWGCDEGAAGSPAAVAAIAARPHTAAMAPAKPWTESAFNEEPVAAAATTRASEVAYEFAVPHLLAVLSARNRAIAWHPAYADIAASGEEGGAGGPRGMGRSPATAASAATAAMAALVALAKPTEATKEAEKELSSAAAEAAALDAEAAAAIAAAEPGGAAAAATSFPPQILSSRPIPAGSVATTPFAPLDWDRLGEVACLALEALARRHSLHRKIIRRSGAMVTLARIVDDAERRHTTRPQFVAAIHRAAALFVAPACKGAAPAVAPATALHHAPAAAVAVTVTASHPAAAALPHGPHGPDCTCGTTGGDALAAPAPATVVMAAAAAPRAADDGGSGSGVAASGSTTDAAAAPPVAPPATASATE